MTTKSLEVESTLSYAHRSGGQVQVVLRLPLTDLSDGTTEVRLRSRKQVQDVAAEVSLDGPDTVLRFAVPEQGLGNRVWRLVLLRGPDRAAVPVQARLLTATARPVALLPGPAPDTRMAPPRPGGPTAQSTLVRAAKRLPSPLQDVLRRGRAAVRRRSG